MSEAVIEEPVIHLKDHELSETTAPPVGEGLVTPSFAPLATFENLWCSTVMNADELRDNPRRVAVDLVRLFLANKTPITLWGPVGARKTRTIQALDGEVDENGVPYQVITIQPSTEDPTVIHGMMYTSLDADTKETVMKRSLPSVVDQIIRYWEEKRGLTILFMDEMTTCLPAQQHALLGLMTHGHYGDKNIQPYISIAMAANPEGTVSTVNELGEQVINRGGHVAWFGDVDLFLEEWGSGFQNPANEPHPTVKWYVTEMLTSASDKAFRDDRWDEDSLVPYDKMEHTERSVTELGRMIELINEIFVTAPPSVRKFYIIQATRALLGNEWADIMGKITEKEAKMLSPESIIEVVRDSGITISTSLEEAQSKESVKALHIMPDGKIIDYAKAESVMDAIIALIQRRGFSLDAYIAAWAWATLSGDDGFTMGMHRSLVRLATEFGKNGITADVLTRNRSVVPDFVSEEVKERIRESVKASQQDASE